MKKINLNIILFIYILVFFIGCGKTEEISSKKKTENKTVHTSEKNNNDWPRIIVDADGHKVTLKEKPEKVVLLHSVYLEYFFALGTPPIASAGASTGNAMDAIQTWETLKDYDKSNKIIDLGSARSLNLEAILKAAPDVIVTFKGQGGLDKIYDQLTKIAPVILIDFSSSWQEQTRICAKILGKEKFGEKIISETEKEIENTKEFYKNHQDKTIALFRIRGKSFVSRGNKKYYDTFGIAKPKTYPDTYEMMSLESVVNMNPDYIIFQTVIPQAKAFVKSFEASATWNNLSAVKNNNIIYFDDSLNTLGPLSMRVTAKKLSKLIKNK